LILFNLVRLDALVGRVAGYLDVDTASPRRAPGSHQWMSGDCERLECAWCGRL